MNDLAQGDFFHDRAYAIEQSKDPMWEELYRSSFPTFASMEYVTDDGWAQRAGIDRLVLLSSGKVLLVDEKIRRAEGARYELGVDVFLEYQHVWSNSARHEPGWIRKDLACDYLAYGWETVAEVLLLPWHPLRLAWRDHRHEWNKAYPAERPDKGQGFRTLGVVVPIDELIAAMGATMRVPLIPD